MSVTELYKITDTLNDLVTLGSLEAEIRASSISAVLEETEAFTNTPAPNDDLKITFDVALSAPDKTTLDALVAAHAGAPIVSTFQFFESNPAQSTVLQTWQTALTRTLVPVTGGIYRLFWSLELRVVVNVALNSGAVARFSVDSNVKANVHHRSMEWTAFSGWDRMVFVSGQAPVLDLEFRRDPTEGGDDTIEIRKLKMGLVGMR